MTAHAKTSSSSKSTNQPTEASDAPAQEVSEASATEAGDAPTTSSSRVEEARRIVKRNTYWAAGAGVVPIPVVDFMAVTAVQVKMLKELTELYKLRFFDDKVKRIIGALVVGTGSKAVTGMIAGSLVKLMPVVGQVVGFVTAPALSAVLTQAIGNLFVMHFESGGTLLTFDVEKMREHFQKEVDNAKVSAKEVHTEKKRSSAMP